MRNLQDLPKLRDSLSYLYVEHVKVERDGGALALFDMTGMTHVPAAALGVLMLGPGTTITHEAMKVLAESGCSVLWVGENAVRMYAQGMGETRSSVRLLHQARLHADQASRMAVVLKMYEKRFTDKLPKGITLEQIRGREGVRVRTAYARASRKTGVAWHGRNYSRHDWNSADPINRALSAASACLNGISHCAVVSAGYSPALGFVHTGKLLSFVYDVSDLYRADVIVPVAFEVTAKFKTASDWSGLEREVRIACRSAFYEHRILERVLKDVDDLMRVSEQEVERARTLVDASDEAPGGLWDPERGEVEGGMNYDPGGP